MDKDTYEALKDIMVQAQPATCNGDREYHAAWDRVMSWMSEVEKEYCDQTLAPRGTGHPLPDKA